MILFSLLLFVLCIAVIAFAASRDLSTMEIVEPGAETEDTHTIRVAL